MSITGKFVLFIVLFLGCLSATKADDIRRFRQDRDYCPSYNEFYFDRGTASPQPPSIKIPHMKWQRYRGNIVIGGMYYNKTELSPYRDSVTGFLGYEITW